MLGAGALTVIVVAHDVAGAPAGRTPSCCSPRCPRRSRWLSRTARCARIAVSRSPSDWPRWLPRRRRGRRRRSATRRTGPSPRAARARRAWAASAAVPAASASRRRPAAPRAPPAARPSRAARPAPGSAAPPARPAPRRPQPRPAARRPPGGGAPGRALVALGRAARRPWRRRQLDSDRGGRLRQGARRRYGRHLEPERDLRPGHRGREHRCDRRLLGTREPGQRGWLADAVQAGRIRWVLADARARAAVPPARRHAGRQQRRHGARAACLRADQGHEPL